MKKILRENIETVVDEHGEIKSTKTYTQVGVNQEPNYVKLYIEDLCLLNEIPKTNSRILNELLAIADYSNEISLSVGTKNRIVQKLDIHKASLDNALTLLTKSEIIQRLDRGLYKLNPYLFGRGDWKNIREIRIAWKYNDTGRRITTVQQDYYDIDEFNNKPFTETPKEENRTPRLFDDNVEELSA